MASPQPSRRTSVLAYSLLEHHSFSRFSCFLREHFFFFLSFFLFRGGRNEVQERLREAVREVSGRAEGCDG